MMTARQWRAVDWTKSRKEIAELLGMPIHQVDYAKQKYAPETIRRNRVATKPRAKKLNDRLREVGERIEGIDDEHVFRG